MDPIVLGNIIFKHWHHRHKTISLLLAFLVSPHKPENSGSFTAHNVTRDEASGEGFMSAITRPQI